MHCSVFRVKADPVAFNSNNFAEASTIDSKKSSPLSSISFLLVASHTQTLFTWIWYTCSSILQCCTSQKPCFEAKRFFKILGFTGKCHLTHPSVYVAKIWKNLIHTGTLVTQAIVAQRWNQGALKIQNNKFASHSASTGDGPEVYAEMLTKNLTPYVTTQVHCKDISAWWDLYSFCLDCRAVVVF